MIIGSTLQLRNTQVHDPQYRHPPSVGCYTPQLALIEGEALAADVRYRNFTALATPYRDADGGISKVGDTGAAYQVTSPDLTPE